MMLNAEQREIIAVTCRELLFGFAARGGSEHSETHTGFVTKDLHKLIENLQLVMNYRARFHADHVFLSVDEIRVLYTGWMNEWLRDNLRPDQQTNLRREKTSIFAAWIRKAFGSKAFLMAM